MRISKTLKVAIIGQYPLRSQDENTGYTGIMRVIYGLVNGLGSCNVIVEVPSRGLKRSKNFWVNIKNIKKILKRLLRLDSEIFHLHGVGHPIFLAFIIAIFRNIPTIYTVHGLIVRERELGYKYSLIHSFYEACFIRYSDRVTTVSEIMRKMSLQSYRVDENKIIAIENGVDSSFINGSKVSLPSNKNGTHHILFVGGTRRVKGLPFLLDSLDIVTKKRGDIELTIVGKKGDQHEMLMSQYKHLINNGHVRFVGVIPENDLHKIYQISDVFVLPSIYEPFGLVVLEAMSKGKTVVVSDRVGAGSIITNNKDGFIVPYGDINSLVEIINSLLKNPRKRKKIGENAKYTAKKYTWEKVAKKYLECYYNLMLNNR